MRSLIEFRFVLSLALAAVIGTMGIHHWPWPADNPILGLISIERPNVYAIFEYTYLTLWFSSPFFAFSIGFSFLYIFGAGWERPAVSGPLPPYPPPEQREDLFLVMGELHHRITPRPAAEPRWLVIPERGLFTGTMIIGAVGSGKTSATMYPYLDQLLAYRADQAESKVGGLFLEVKGDFCKKVHAILTRRGRAADYVDVGLNSPYRYNPLHNDLDAYALAYGIATLMTNLFGKGKEPFWQQASTNLVKFVILLHKVLDDYVTLFQVYEHVINPGKLRAKIADGERRFNASPRRIIVDKRAHVSATALAAWHWQEDAAGQNSWTDWTADLEEVLTAGNIPYRTEDMTQTEADADRKAQFEACKRWFEDDWTSMDSKLRTSIVEGISVFLSLFDDNPKVKYAFCPPKELYDPAKNLDGALGVPLPLSELIEEGKVLALNFPSAQNAGLARALGTMLKQDFQRAVLNRIPTMDADAGLTRRPVMFVCDEYQEFATTGVNEPSGDERFFSLARQARCIPLVATQSISSLRSTLTGESWRVLLQGFRTKIFLTLTDDFSQEMAANLCGKEERLKASYTISEAGQDARVSMLTGNPAAHKTTVTASKTYSPSLEYVFQPKIFAELKNSQAIALVYDGVNPLPPSYLYLKPYQRDVQTSYFDQLAKGQL